MKDYMNNIPQGKRVRVKTTGCYLSFLDNENVVQKLFESASNQWQKVSLMLDEQCLSFAEIVDSVQRTATHLRKKVGNQTDRDSMMSLQHYRNKCQNEFTLV